MSQEIRDRIRLKVARYFVHRKPKNVDHPHLNQENELDDLIIKYEPKESDISSSHCPSSLTIPSH